MNRSVESILRFVNLASSGLLAGSLGFGEAALVPGWEDERPRERDTHETSKYFNAIGPVALATSLTLALASRQGSKAKRALDLVSALGLAGVVGATLLATVPIGKRLEQSRPLDYPSIDSKELVDFWGRAHSTRTALGVTAFLCAAASSVMHRAQRP